jgi:hypothetical protein
LALEGQRKKKQMMLNNHTLALATQVGSVKRKKGGDIQDTLIKGVKSVRTASEREGLM